MTRTPTCHMWPNDCILEWMLEVEHCNYQLLIIKDNENKWENEKNSINGWHRDITQCVGSNY
jgi:hypothetical protein